MEGCVWLVELLVEAYRARATVSVYSCVGICMNECMMYKAKGWLTSAGIDLYISKLPTSLIDEVF